MVKLWLILGFLGWITLMLYRVLTDGLPKEVSFMSYVRGFIMALVMGPLCFVFLVCLLLTQRSND